MTYSKSQSITSVTITKISLQCILNEKNKELIAVLSENWRKIICKLLKVINILQIMNTTGHMLTRVYITYKCISW